MRSVIIINKNNSYLQVIFIKNRRFREEKNANACGLLGLALYLHGLRP